MEKSQVHVTAAGLLGAVDVVKQKDVVRRVQKGTELEKASVFAGLERTNTFSSHPGVNCSSGHGGADLGRQMQGKSLDECQDACGADDDCTCISHEATKGICSKQKNCYLESCVPSSLVHTYEMHSTFKLRAKKRANKAKKTKSHSWTGHLLEGRESFQVQDAYYRTGGRDCNGGGAHDNATVLSVGHYDFPRDVVQCLTDCDNLMSCSCVKFERYYQQACFLMADCPSPKVCSRSNEYDTYIYLGDMELKTAAPTPPTYAPTPAPTFEPTPYPTPSPTAKSQSCIDFESNSTSEADKIAYLEQRALNCGSPQCAYHTSIPVCGLNGTFIVCGEDMLWEAHYAMGGTPATQGQTQAGQNNIEGWEGNHTWYHFGPYANLTIGEVPQPENCATFESDSASMFEMVKYLVYRQYLDNNTHHMIQMALNNISYANANVSGGRDISDDGSD
jgi:hypothetical protein